MYPNQTKARSPFDGAEACGQEQPLSGLRLGQTGSHPQQTVGGESEIYAQLLRLSQGLCGLRDHVETLAVRLTPVLPNATEKLPVNSEPLDQVHSPLGHELQALYQEIWSLDAKILQLTAILTL